MEENLRWCCKNDNYAVSDCIIHQEEDGCCLWLCECGHTCLVHELLSKGQDGCKEDTYPECSCKKFQFKSNDDCTIECQFQRKVYENSLEHKKSNEKI